VIYREIAFLIVYSCVEGKNFAATHTTTQFVNL